jgi:hypothetical protein
MRGWEFNTITLAPGRPDFESASNTLPRTVWVMVCAFKFAENKKVINVKRIFFILTL